ncbi:CidA/LrgA family protein [Novosphingobium resinovorum]|jgi:holin-like protein|uniref:CidA/LrgA family protein n=2 Tax=Sphingomonadaceae TaxID=41297 RepID=UPI00232A02F2|nr:CidA/LrgA family protein [Novosphingobium resinovorum]
MRIAEHVSPCFIPVMLRAIFLLLACQLAGEAIHRITSLPLPGAVIGMVLLVGWLALVPRERPTLTVVTGWLTAHLSIMFVPAAVGLIEEGPVLSRYGVGLVTATVASTLLTLIVTALVFRWAFARFAPEGEA